MVGNWKYWYHNGEKECELNLSNNGNLIDGNVYHDNGKLKLQRRLND